MIHTFSLRVHHIPAAWVASSSPRLGNSARQEKEQISSTGVPGGQLVMFKHSEFSQSPGQETTWQYRRHKLGIPYSTLELIILSPPTTGWVLEVSLLK